MVLQHSCHDFLVFLSQGKTLEIIYLYMAFYLKFICAKKIMYTLTELRWLVSSEATAS